MLPNLAGLPATNACTPLDKEPAAELSEQEKKEKAELNKVNKVLDEASTSPVEKDRYYTEPDGASSQDGATRGSRTLVLSQPLVDMLDYYNNDSAVEGLLDALLRRKLDAAMQTCKGEGETNAKLAYLDIDTAPAVDGVTSDQLKDTVVISVGVTNVDVLLESYLGATASWATGLDKIKHAHACIPVHVFVTCAKEEDPEQHKTGRDEIEFRRLNIEVSAHLAPFVVFVNEGQDPTKATQHSGTASYKLVDWVLRKLNPIMPLPNLPRKTERRPWRMLYEEAALEGLNTDGLDKADNTFGLKAVKKKEGNPGIFGRLFGSGK